MRIPPAFEARVASDPPLAIDRIARPSLLRSTLSGLLAWAVLPLLAAPALAQNEIVTENALPGNPPAEWDVSGAGDASIQGFATDISVDQGGTVEFKIDTDATSYRIDIYRLGWYGGDGARLVASVLPSATLPQVQPAGIFDPTTNLLDCGNWGVSASWTVPGTAVSGIYLAKLVRTDPEDGRASHVLFVVRDDDGASSILMQTSDTTWQAYNQYGTAGLTSGSSLYPSPGGQADKVSYNRPFTTRAAPIEDWVFNAEYPMVRWLERNGYDVSYFTNVDTDRHGAEILEHEVFLSVGHDEYWSRGMRTNVEAARDAGVHLAFFSGNEVYWKVRWEDSVDGNGTPYRTLVCYKEGTLGENQCGTKCDPVADVWTGLWRSGCDWTPPADGCEPENALTGQMSWMGTTGAIQVPAAYGHLPFWRNTSVASLQIGEVATLANSTLGYEWDQEQYEESYPEGRLRMSETDFSGETHHLSLYRHQASGALVFGAGTVQWSWGLDDVHDRAGGGEDARMQQATVNLFADMGVAPATLQAGLLYDPLPADTDPPVSAISFPASGAHVESGSPVTVVGTASDPNGGIITLVEVSDDGGATWQPADGFEAWTYTWTPGAPGAATLLSRAWDGPLNAETPGAGVPVTIDARDCPCSIWSDAVLPGTESVNDPSAIEVGVKFQTDNDGYITAIRFYKGAANTGVHTGHLWAADGTLLGTADFQGETATGWQEEPLNAPVAVTANTTYVASYHTTSGNYAFDAGFFGGGGVDNAPLHALGDGVDGPNGVYIYGASAFPTDTFNSANYWVDVVFDSSATDTSPPALSVRSPGPGALAVALGTNVTATFNEAVQAGSIVFELKDPFNAPVAATVTYDAPSRTATLDPAADLDPSSLYTAEVSGALDLAGNPMAGLDAWSFTTQDPPPPPPTEGPGGPILVIGDAANPFGLYFAEILRAEGLNEFATADISAMDATLLAQHDVVILGEMPLSGAQVTLLSDWVTAGGNLVAMRPDAQLAALLGLGAPAGTLPDAYLLLDTGSGPGVGLVAETIQFHGTADQWTTAGATVLATLYTDPFTPSVYPAITLRDVGGSGGQAAAFLYDLARSVVTTRQGNPAWAGQERDGTAPIRPDDLFYGAAAGDPQPDWVNLDKVAIPQADEQQRMLANLILAMNEDRAPLPRFWYLPAGHKAAVVLTGDDHSGSTRDRLALYQAQDPGGCSVDSWECVRSTAYIYPGNPMSDAEAAAFQAAGFEIGLHLNTGCANWTPASLDSDYTAQLASLAAQYPSIPASPSQRHHCITWSDWATVPQTQVGHGIRLDTNYYYWPPGWVQNRPGMFTGSGLPMRFAETDGTMIDVFQVATQMTDESGQSYPFTIDTLLDRAQGPEGYYGTFCANMHADSPASPGADAIVASAQARGVPIISARQLLTWIDARNASSFGAIDWTANVLSFDVVRSPSALDLEGMIPAAVGAGPLASLTRDFVPVAWRTETIKGIQYAIFPAEDGAYEATYAVDSTPPVITARTAVPDTDGTALVTWNTDESADSRVDWGTDPGNLNTSVSEAALVTSHGLTLTGLPPGTTIHYRVTSADASANGATDPPLIDPPATFVTPVSVTCLAATTAADFLAGTPDAGITVAEIGDGDLILTPTEGSDFFGATLPAGWSATPWSGGGGAIVGGGVIEVDGALVAPATQYGPGRSLEFVATFAAVPFQHVGLAVDFDATPTWAMFSTHSDGTDLWARTNPGGANVNLGPGWIGSSHLYRIDWTATTVDFFIDGGLVHSQAVALPGTLRPALSDFAVDAVSLVVDWVRLTPYAPAGTYESAVHDAGQSVNWGVVDWTSSEPPATSLDVLVRTGETPVPDGTWTGWLTVSTSGNSLGAAGRYLQYRADLAAADPDATPVLSSISFECESGPDLTPPTITNLAAAPGPDGTTATVTWDTNEPADSRADFGTDPGMLGSFVADAPFVTSHSLELTGLTPGATYHYRATSADAATNSATEPMPPAAPATFVTPYPPCAVDALAADFLLGTTAGTAVVSAGDGEVILAPTTGSDFDGGSLPAGWDAFAWSGGGAATVAGGAVSVDGARLREQTFRTAGHSVEFRATFAAGPGNRLQHVGFAGGADLAPGEMFNTAPWAIFSSGSAGAALQARVWDGGAFLDTTIPGSWFGVPHVYRIDWNATSVDFFVDGALVHTEVVTIASGDMRIGASDFDPNGTPLVIDWVRLAPYPGNGTFASRVFDAGGPADWNEVTWTADEPAGTSVALEVRVGDTAVPDGSWTGWIPVASSGSVVALAGQYLQYRGLLASADPYATPALDDVSVTCGVCTDVTPPPAVAALASAPHAGPNPPGGVTQVDLSWAPVEAGATVSLYRKGFGDYPAYAGGSAPVAPLDPDAALAEGWALAAVLADTDSTHTDAPPGRDFWYWVAFAEDACSNVSPVSALTGGALSYHLGDVTDGITPGTGDNAVDIADFSALGGAYGAQSGGGSYQAFLDFGPTDDGSVNGRPVPDGSIDFEELVLLAINYEEVRLARSKPAPPAAADANRLVLVVPTSIPQEGTFDARVWLEADGRPQAVSAALSWDGSVVEPVSVGAGELLDVQAGSAVLLSPAPGALDVAMLGSTGGGLSGSGFVAEVTFRVVGGGAPKLAIAGAHARDAANLDLPLALDTATGVDEIAGLPRITVLHGNAPNPFGESTRLSFDLARRGRVSLRIFSVDGRLVRTLVDGEQAPGRYTVVWDGRDEGGQRVASNVYFYRFEAPDTRTTRKMVRLR